MEDYKEKLSLNLARTGALFFDKGLVLKDGRPTPYFVNMAMFRSGRLSIEMGSFFAAMMVSEGLVKETDIILGPSYKGSSIALATSIALWQEYAIDLNFEYDRKEAKTHGEGSKTKSMFVNGTLFDGCRIFIVDDVATSMKTKYDLLGKIESDGGENSRSHISGIGICIDRQQTTAVYDARGNVVLNRKGEDAVKDFVSKSGVPVFAVAGIREVVDYLHKKKEPVLINGVSMPMGDGTKAEFDEYLNGYGTN
jgi:orotate phosphoribosyltransferase